MSAAVALAERLFAAFASRDIETLTHAIAPDAVWRFPGRTGQLAGEHRGREAIFRFLLDVVSLTDGTFHMDRRGLVGDATTAYAEFVGRGSRAGKTLENPTCLKLVFRDGALVEAQEWVWDLAHVEDFWA